MKCERCGSPIKKGELYCQKCGAKIKDELNDTINVSILKGNSNDNDDPFYNKNLETNNSLNIFLVILVVVLLIALGLLLLYFYKNNNLATTKEKEEVIKDIYYDEYHLALDNNISILYSNDKLLLKSDNYELSIYTISDKYNDIVRNLDEIKLKWEELGLNIVSSEELKNNLYEVICTYQNHEHIFYIKNMDKTLKL